MQLKIVRNTQERPNPTEHDPNANHSKVHRAQKHCLTQFSWSAMTWCRPFTCFDCETIVVNERGHDNLRSCPFHLNKSSLGQTVTSPYPSVQFFHGSLNKAQSSFPFSKYKRTAYVVLPKTNSVKVYTCFSCRFRAIVTCVVVLKSERKLFQHASQLSLPFVSHPYIGLRQQSYHNSPDHQPGE